LFTANRRAGRVIATQRRAPVWNEAVERTVRPFEAGDQRSQLVGELAGVLERYTDAL
jgi:hypothetical protein